MTARQRVEPVVVAAMDLAELDVIAGLRRAGAPTPGGDRVARRVARYSDLVLLAAGEPDPELGRLAERDLAAARRRRRA